MKIDFTLLLEIDLLLKLEITLIMQQLKTANHALELGVNRSTKLMQVLDYVWRRLWESYSYKKKLLGYIFFLIFDNQEFIGLYTFLLSCE